MGQYEHDEDDDMTSQTNSARRERRLAMSRMKQKMKNALREEEYANESSHGGDDFNEDAVPSGDVVRVSGEGRSKRIHFQAFECDGTHFELDDVVLLLPEDINKKPSVAIIKDIIQNRDGSLNVSGQRFYRPEEAPNKGCGNWESHDTRELFYTFHCDEVPAESVMHKCVVHFIPLNRKIPSQKVHPGFIVQKVYDTVEKKLWKLTDKDYEDRKQYEIDLLVRKTKACLGELSDGETEDPVQKEDPSRSKRTLNRKNLSPIDVTRDYDLASSIDPRKLETPSSGPNTSSEYYSILDKFRATTRNACRNKWLERLLQGVQHVCNMPKSVVKENEEKGRTRSVDTYAESANASHQKTEKSEGIRRWPDDAVLAVTALEQAVHVAYALDNQKYNQKMRKLDFNLKDNKVLARRLLDRELQPSQILNMTPNELKEGLTAEETSSREPDESKRVKMTDTRCKRCGAKKVGLTDIIHGGKRDRYQLECIACGNTWFASSDEVLMATIEGPSIGTNVGAAPLGTEAYMPLLEAQKSLQLSP